MFFFSLMVKLQIQKPQLSWCAISSQIKPLCRKDLLVYIEAVFVGASPWEAQSLSKLRQASEQFYEVYKSWGLCHLCWW